MGEHLQEATRRLFIAVMLSAPLQERLAGLIDLLDAHRAILRPVRPEAIHVTLRFLGELTSAQEQGVMEACAAATMGLATFPLAIGGFGVFPSTRQPRVLWLGCPTGGDALVALHRRLQDELLRRRLVERHEEFTPHLTLARVRPEAGRPARAALGAAIAALPTGEQARCQATEVSLVHSTLTPQGPRYAIVQTWSLDPTP